MAAGRCVSPAPTARSRSAAHSKTISRLPRGTCPASTRRSRGKATARCSSISAPTAAASNSMPTAAQPKCAPRAWRFTAEAQSCWLRFRVNRPRATISSNSRWLRSSVLAVEHQQLSDLLHRFGAGALAQRLERHLARVSLERRGAHLDELVRLQREIHFLHHLVGEAFGADHHHRLELVGARLERFALRWP